MSMSKFVKYFLRGFFAIMPIALSISILIWLFNFSEGILSRIFFAAFPEFHIPGSGILLGVFLVFLLGYFLSSPVFFKFFSLFELPFKNVPFVKTVYTAFKDLMLYFSNESGTKQSHVVIIKHPDSEIQIIGLLTNSSLHSLPKEMKKDGTVGVFIPMSYGLGGYTVFVPEKWIVYTQMPVELAMKSALMAWIEKPTNTDHNHHEIN